VTLLHTGFETLADGSRVRVARAGTPGANPPLVLLHGYPDNALIWSRLAPLLASHAEVIAFDWPGMGDSPAWAGGGTPRHQAERLLRLVDHWQLERVALVGMDMGGQPALAFAALHPRRISHLTVMNSLVIPDADTSWEIRLLRRYGWNRWLLRHLPGLVFRRAVRTSLPRGEPLPDELRDELWRCFSRPEVRASIAKMCAGYQGTLDQLPELYARVACPTLVLWGRNDVHFPPRHGEDLQRMIRGSQLVLLDGGHHWMAWHRAEAVAEAIVRSTLAAGPDRKAGEQHDRTRRHDGEL
jgi:pimeloyl-ACP methyl ester carboxylesterase